MFDLLIGLASIAFFGFGAIVLLRQRNYLYTIGCLVFVFIGIILILPESNTSKNELEFAESQPANANSIPKEIETIKPTIILKNDHIYNQETNYLLNIVENIVDTDFTFETSIKQIELNEHIGTENTEDFIALISLSYDQLHSEETTKKWIDQYTSHLATKLAKEPIAISSLIIFWETPRFKEDWNTAKISFVKQNDGQFYFESEDYDASVFE